MKVSEYLALDEDGQNALVAEHVMGWKKENYRHETVVIRSGEYVRDKVSIWQTPNGKTRIHIPKYTTEWNAMRLVIERMRTSDIFSEFCIYLAEMFRANTDDYEHNMRGLFFNLNPEAVSIAALKARGVLEDD